MANTYSWSAFDLNEALKGTLVGLHDVTDDSNFGKTGTLERDTKYPTAQYRATIRGESVWCDADGKIAVGTIQGANVAGETLQLATAVLEQPQTVIETRSGDHTATLSSMTPRDQFATEIINSIITHLPDAPNLDDGAMLVAARNAYRWAQAMMLAAYDYRQDDQTSTDPSTSIVSALSPLKVKGGSTYTPSGGTAIPDVLNVNVVAGGGGGGGSTNVNLDDLINGLGYDKNATPVANATQAGKMDELIAAVTAAGKIKKADVSNVGDTQAAIDSVSDILVFSDFNAIVPYKVTPLQLANRMAQYDGLVERTVPSFPSALFLLMGSYYKLSVSTSDVAINLPALSSDGMAKIVIFRFTCTAATGGTTASFSVTVSGGGAKKGRGSAIPLTLTPGTYEVDCVDNGSEWIVGVTEIVS